MQSVFKSSGVLIAIFLFSMAFFGMATGNPCLAQKKEKKKPVAGKADVLRHIPKKFASFEKYDPKNKTVTLHIEGENQATTWKLKPGTEIKFHGWWGRPEQFRRGDRVWAWFSINRNKKRTGILMLADEISEQDIHDLPATIDSVNEKERKVTFRYKRGPKRTLELPARLVKKRLKKGDKVYLQSDADAVRLLLAGKQFKQARNKQKELLRAEWRKEGLPGMVSFLHPLGGEMEIMLDHESMRWGRYLKNGDTITVRVDTAKAKPIKAQVRKVEPWREFTRLLLVTNSGVDQLDLRPGQRIHALIKEPPKEVQDSSLPTDLGRKRSREERLEWFLATIYCTCKVAGDRCTGMFYTLASCNRNACGNPNMMRNMIAKMIDEGLTDQQIFERLLKSRGAQLLKPHLLQ